MFVTTPVKTSMFLHTILLDLAQRMDYLAQRVDLVRRLDVAEAALMQMRADWDDVVRQAVGRVLEIVNPDQYHAPLILQGRWHCCMCRKTLSRVI